MGPAALPAIASPITIVGNGATIQRVADIATPPFRLIFVGADAAAADTLAYATPGPGTLTLEDLTLQGGLAKGGDSSNGGGGAGMGGAIYNQGDLALKRVTITNSYATGGATRVAGTTRAGGGIGSNASGIVGGGFGGGAFTGASSGGALSSDRGGGGGGFRGTENGLAGGRRRRRWAQIRDLPAKADCERAGTPGDGGGSGARGGGGQRALTQPREAAGPRRRLGTASAREAVAAAGVGGAAEARARMAVAVAVVSAAADGVSGGGRATRWVWRRRRWRRWRRGPQAVRGRQRWRQPDPDDVRGGGGAGMGGAIFNLQGQVDPNSTLAGNERGRRRVAQAVREPGQGIGGAIFNLNGDITVTFFGLADNAAGGSSGGIFNTGYMGNDTGDIGSPVLRRLDPRHRLIFVNGGATAVRSDAAATVVGGDQHRDKQHRAGRNGHRALDVARG